MPCYPAAGAQHLLAPPEQGSKAAPPAAAFAAAGARGKSAGREGAVNAPSSSWLIGSAAPSVPAMPHSAGAATTACPTAGQATPAAQQQAAAAEERPAPLATSRHSHASNEQEAEPASPLFSDEAAILAFDAATATAASLPTGCSSPAPVTLLKCCSSRRRGQPAVLRQLSRTASGASELPRRARARLAASMQRLRGRLAALGCMAPHAHAVLA